MLVAAALAAAATAASAGQVDVNATVQNAINENPTARAAVFQAMGVTDPTWRINAVKVSHLKNSSIQLQLPPYSYEYVTSSEIINCAPTATSRQVTLSNQVTNSVTVTKSDTLEVGAEVSLSAEYMGVSASATASTNYSMTNENSQTNETTQSIEDSTTVGFDDAGGRISVLQAKKMQGRSIPWTATFTPEDGDMIQLMAGPPAGAGHLACFYEHKDYGGKSTCWGAGDHNYFGNAFNDIISSIKIYNYVVTIYEHKDFGGKSRTLTASEPYVGDAWNDMISSVKITYPGKTASVRFGAIKAALPEAARVFTVHGAMDVSQTAFQDKRIVNYVMSDADVRQACANAPSDTSTVAAMRAAPAGTAAMKAPAAAKMSAQQAAAALRVRRLSDSEARKLLSNAHL